MRLDHIARLIESADPVSFREVAHLYLSTSGYEPANTDGPRDGGSDVALFRLGANPEPLAVQVSVQKSNWERKVRQDAQRALDVLGRRHFVYITSRRIPNVDAGPLIDDLWANQGVTLRIIDSQSIASHFFSAGDASGLLSALGIQGVGSGARKDRVNLREDLAYSYAFFGADVRSFQEAALDSSVAAFIVRSQSPPTHDAIVSEVGRALGLRKDRQSLVAARIDALTQRGQLVLEDGRFHLAARLDDAQRAARTVRNVQWRSLKADLTRTLVEAGLTGRSLERCEEIVEQSAGALMLKAASSTAAAISPSLDTGPAKQQMWSKLRRLESDLTNYGLRDEVVNQVVRNLTSKISNSEFGQTLLAGEVFLSLLQMGKSDLLRALGGEREVDIFLDASVAIPILIGLLYEPHAEYFFTAAVYAYQQVVSHDLGIFLPRDYLEESASHLLEAWETYRPILEVDPDLMFSKNAYVSHYLALKNGKRPDLSFEDYVRSFGLRTSRGQIRSFRDERDWVMNRMRTLFGKYNISISEARELPPGARRGAETAIAYTARELGLERKGPLLEHDARAVADISARAALGESAVIFCTWDRLHLRLRNAEGPVAWNALDPVSLGDLLSLASPDDDQPLRSALEIALEFGEAEARRGAEIWDELARIEGGNLYDAELLAKAKAFKDDYLERITASEKPVPLASAWAQWKAGTAAESSAQSSL